ncbi:membrane alanyl aminopeptidase [Antricoccus suffuscus]|uniref:Aminopeptidase N n=1 Tax=Antricoccus suffuscus TaxID=1629062 RepID=A0A2T1A3E7_9ACTN|nr:aminopeptidase N [Antricoccus suffuscus]PRZ43132.1 membrane alanyl aminopeptidase [Antricoccus suffuscus]
MATTDAPFYSLQHTEAQARSELLTVRSYDVRLDLAADDATYRSVTTVRFDSHGGRTFVDLKPLRINDIRLNGRAIDADLLDRGRLPLETIDGPNELTVDAVMRFRNDGEGLHRSVDPADGRHYVYGMSFMDAAPSIFACFDQPDLKAPYTFHVTAPPDWIVVGNAPGEQVSTGVWEFAKSQPLSTYFVTLVAGPYYLIRDEHDGIPLGLSARQSIAKDLDTDADELLTMTRQCFDEYHRLFGIRYPFGDYHQAFVPEFNAGAMENPGCVTFRDPLVFSSRVTRGDRIRRATTLAHEMAHQWFGNLVTPQWWDDLWLNESFAEYMGNRVTADVTEYADAWTHNAFARRQWGLIADQRPSTHPVAGNGAADASTALQNFDGISYTKGSSILKQLNTAIGDDVFMRGAIDHFTTHRFGNATMDDLFNSWEKAGAADLSTFTSSWLRTAGPDTLALDRSAGAVRRTPPSDYPADRRHTLRVGVAAPGEDWRIDTITVDGPDTPYAAPSDAAVVLDPHEDTWALVQPDATTVDALVELLPRTTDGLMRAGVWNGVRSAFHNAAIDPAQVLSLVEAAIPVEDNDDAIGATMPWAIGKVAALSADQPLALGRIHRACLALLDNAPADSTLQLSAFQSAASSSTDPAKLRAWLSGRSLPAGLRIDLDLRWRILVRLAVLGETDRDDLAKALEVDSTARAIVEHTRAVASLPDAEAKDWAWRRFTGEDDVPNYELEAAGTAMWRTGQESLTEPYVERYFAELPGTVAVRSGWVLADAAGWFFPITSLSPGTLDQCRALIQTEGLEGSLRRTVVDMTDELERRLAVRERYAAP